eukprot:m.14896 g.14896  ORF g.14896 m.14896 type:complete len:213 (-) comp8188_c0_seq1:43-681(-)
MSEERLDELLCAYMELYDKAKALKMELSELMKSGFWFMSKARSTLGQAVVSESQYPKSMSAALCVSSDDEQLFAVVSSGNENKAAAAHSLAGTTTETTGGAAAGVVKEDGLRQRHSTKSADTATPAAASASADAAGRKPAAGPLVNKADPIRWFGVLVPTSLRAAQDKFKQAAKLTATIASVHYQMDQLQLQFVAERAKLVSNRKDSEQQQR